MCHQLNDNDIELALRSSKGVKQARLVGALVSYAVGVDDLIDTMGTSGYRTSTTESCSNLIERLDTLGFALVTAPNVVGAERIFLANRCVGYQSLADTRIHGCTCVDIRSRTSDRR